MYCIRCGARLPEEALFCPACGAPRHADGLPGAIGPPGTTRERIVPSNVGQWAATGLDDAHERGRLTNRHAFSPAGAVICSLLITGLGQLVLGQGAKAAVILLGTIVLAVLTYGAALVVILPLVAIDAYCIARKLRMGQSVGKWELF